MNVGYHFHVPAQIGARGRVRYPAHFGVFIEELARQAGAVTFFAFEESAGAMHDRELDPSLVRVVSLGRRRSGPATRYLARTAIARIRESLTDIDVMLIRGPGPLIPKVLRVRQGPPVVALMMGDLRSWRPNQANTRWRNALIRRYLQAYLRDEINALRDSHVLVNNRWLREHLEREGCVDVREVFTSTLTQEMVAQAAADGSPCDRDLQASEPVRLLYTGRLVEEKGILDVVRALIELRRGGVRAVLELVGWAPDADPTIDRARRVARDAGAGDAIDVVGYVPLGPQLVDRYRRADVYIFASPTEWGLPQTMIEAMAVGLPVVTTDFEGRRGLLREGTHLLVAPPRSPLALADRVRELVHNPSLRRRIGRNGREWARRRTNEESARQVLGHLGSIVDEELKS